MVESLLADEMLMLFGDDEFIKSAPVGYEDAHKAETVNRLLRYVFSLEGHYRSMKTPMGFSQLWGRATGTRTQGSL